MYYYFGIQHGERLLNTYEQSIVFHGHFLWQRHYSGLSFITRVLLLLGARKLFCFRNSTATLGLYPRDRGTIGTDGSLDTRQRNK